MKKNTSKSENIPRILTQPKDPEVRGLLDDWKAGRLDIQPSFQRNFVWDVKQCSSLIESALLDVPLPAIYLAEEEDSKQSVIDGQQRLTAFFSFIDGNFPYGEKSRFG